VPIHHNSLRPVLVVAHHFLAVLFSSAAVNGQSNSWRIPGSEQSSPVTVQELRHDVPKAARAEMDKAEKASRKRRTDEEIEHLRKAVGIDPEFIAARNNLAVSLMIRDTEFAVAQLQEAIQIDSNRPVLFYNLALGYLMLHKLDDAESAARTARMLGLTDLRAKLLLGWVLAAEEKYTAEALSLVKSAREEHPLANMLTARVLIGQNRPEEAKSYIYAYLSTGDEEYRDYAARWLDYIANTQQQNRGKKFAQEATLSPVGSSGADDRGR